MLVILTEGSDHIIHDVGRLHIKVLQKVELPIRLQLLPDNKPVDIHTKVKADIQRFVRITILILPAIHIAQHIEIVFNVVNVAIIKMPLIAMDITAQCRIKAIFDPAGSFIKDLHQKQKLGKIFIQLIDIRYSQILNVVKTVEFRIKYAGFAGVIPK